MPLSKRQRLSILERDNFQSQLRHYSEEQGWFTTGDDGSGLQVHHIKPQRWGGEDDPENLITINRTEHIGVAPDGSLLNFLNAFIIHPDVTEAYARYRQGIKTAFSDMFAMRDAFIQQGEIYHNPDHDDEMLETAWERTKAAAILGWFFPGKDK